MKLLLFVLYSNSLFLGTNELTDLYVEKVLNSPVIDGELNDECWKELKIIKDFRQRRPNEGEPATEKTEVRICRNDKTLFIGVRCFDSQPEKVRAGVMQRDATVKGDDYFFVLIDPFGRSREGYYFRTNANGAKGEALINSDMSKPKMDWDTIWDVKSKIDDLGWTAEFAIPFRVFLLMLNLTHGGLILADGSHVVRSVPNGLGFLVTEIGSLSRMPEKLAD